MLSDHTRPARISRRKFLARTAGTAAALSTAPRGTLASFTSVGRSDSPGPDTARVSTIRVDAAPGHATNSFRPHHALGTSIDILSYGSVDKLYTEPIIKKCLSAGWGPMSYRQNTELQIAAWHWNPNGTWSDRKHKQGYFTGNAKPTEFLRHSYGYPLPHRGHTRNGGAEHGYSRLTDGDPESYWKSNPYLTRRFTGEDDSLHPQWVVIDLGSTEPVSHIRIDWLDPYAVNFEVQYWVAEKPSSSEGPMDRPTSGIWTAFPNGTITNGKGRSPTLQLSSTPI